MTVTIMIRPPGVPLIVVAKSSTLQTTGPIRAVGLFVGTDL